MAWSMTKTVSLSRWIITLLCCVVLVAPAKSEADGGINKDELGTIELKQDCAFVSVPLTKADALVNVLNNSRLKKKKVRIYVVE